MTFYDENKHPRGQADNAGQFRDKSNSGPEAALAPGDPGAPVGGLRTDQVVLHYVCDEHDSPIRAEQPLTDIVYAGTLICPECGEDMALENSVGVRAVPDDPNAPAFADTPEAIAARIAEDLDYFDDGGPNTSGDDVRDMLARAAREAQSTERLAAAQAQADRRADDIRATEYVNWLRRKIYERDEIIEAQGGRPASDPAIELVEWARTAQEFMRSDKSNDWGEEVAALDAILESDD